LQGATHTLFSLRMKGLILSVAMCLVFARLHADPDNVSAALEKIRDDHNIPGLAAAVMDEGKFVAVGATGMRNAGRMVPVTLDDKWHVGSCTKSMTASVAAMLVENGKIRWNTTVAEIFPDGIEEMNHAWRDVTLEQLLTHRGGAPHDPPKDLYAVALNQEGDPKEQRKNLSPGSSAGRPRNRRARTSSTATAATRSRARCSSARAARRGRISCASGCSSRSG
jgi:CubicO group peptidase (beta-lactamase class C family)